MSICRLLVLVLVLGFAGPGLAQDATPETPDAEQPVADPASEADDTAEAEPEAEPEPPPIVVVAPFNLTGDESVLDVAAANGALLAAKQINENGGIDGRKVNVALVDTQSRPSLVTSRVEDALARAPNAIAGIGYSYSDEALLAGRVFQAKGLPFVSPGATDPTVPAEVGDDMFFAAYGDDAQADAMARFLREELKVESAAVWIDHQHLYTRTIGEDFEKAFAALGGTIALIQADNDPAGYDIFLSELKSLSPPAGAIYAASQPADASGILAKTRAAGIAVPLASGDGWDDESVATASLDDRLRDIYFTTHMFIGVDSPEMKAFVRAYRDAYGRDPGNAFAALGYDTINLLADAIRRAGSTEPDAIRQALADTRDFKGIVGKIAYSPDSRVPIKPVAIIEVIQGAQTLRWVAEPGE